MRGLKVAFVSVALIVFISSCSPRQDSNIRLIDAKTAINVNEKYQPVGATNVFPQDASRIFLWFSWKGADKDAKLVARWHYVTDDIPILDYTFTIPRKEGAGSVSLSMPEGKTLPPGFYRVSLEYEKRQLKSLTFKVSEKK